MKSNTIPKVDRDSPMPIYLQIASDLTARISQEEWGVGAKLPSENELSKEYDTSRLTLRQALAKLESDGLIDRQRGRGAFVKTNPDMMVQDLYLPLIEGNKPFSGITYADVHLSVVNQANSKVTSSLQVEPGTPLVYLERLFLKKERVIALNRAWFPLHKVPGMADEKLINNSINDTLQQRYNIHFASVDNYIEALMLDAAMSQLLETVSPSPALKINSIYTMDGGSPIEYAVTIWNGRDTQFHVLISSN